jgi:hypothetical protein
MREKEEISVWGACAEPFWLSEPAWRLLLTLGHSYGWQPAGTLPPDPEAFDDALGDRSDWDGHYFPCDSQVMTVEDAHALADALERALADLPDHDALTGKAAVTRGGKDNPYPVWALQAAPGIVLSPVEAFSGANKTLLRGFIEHCRKCAEFSLCGFPPDV